MEMVVSFVVPSVTPVGSVPKESLTDSPSSSVLSWAAEKVMDSLGVAGVEGDAAWDAGVVGARRSVLVGLGDGNGDRPLRVLGEGDLDRRGTALGHGVG